MAADYNRTKCGVNQSNEMTKNFSYSPATRRWPVKILLWLLNVGAIYAWVLRQKQKKLFSADAGKRRSFLFNPSKQQMEVQQKKHYRSNNYLIAKFRKIAEAKANIERKVRGDQPTLAFKCPICKITKRMSIECQKCYRQVCLDNALQINYGKDYQSISPPRKASASTVTPHVTRSQTKSAEPRIGRCALCPPNQKIHSTNDVHQAINRFV